MILHALKGYYDRGMLAPPGWEYKEIPFMVVLAEDGSFVQLENRTDETNRRGPPLLVPQSEIRAGKNAWMQPNLLWDHYGFVLGEPKRKTNGELDPSDSPEKAVRQRNAFIARVEGLLARFPGAAGLRAVSAFYQRSEFLNVASDPNFKELLRIPGANLTFRLVTSVEPAIHEDWVQTYVRALQADYENSETSEGREEKRRAVCLVTGELQPIARLHPKTKGVCDKPTAFAAANTTEFPAYSSFGKTQGYNFPVGKPAAFAYTTALNHLLAKGSRNRFQVGDASTVCWSEQDSEFDTVLADLFGEAPPDDPDRGRDAVRALFEAMHSGKLATPEGATRYYVLGLAPNAARISVRFFHCLPLAELAPRVLQHFEDLKLAHAAHDPEYPPLYRTHPRGGSLLTACAVQGKADNVPPTLGGAIVDAILAGTDAPYPSLWLNAAVNRCRAERAVSYLRAAGIKACLNRIIRRQAKEKEFQPMLDPDNTSPAYRLGRLFAALEKVQEEANPGINATIRDRYFGAASSTPVAVFSTLLRLKNAHLKKLSDGREIYFERLVGQILNSVADFPRHLALPDQGRFALGYYHQRHAFYTKTESNGPAKENN